MVYPSLDRLVPLDLYQNFLQHYVNLHIFQDPECSVKTIQNSLPDKFVYSGPEPLIEGSSQSTNGTILRHSYDFE
jgi:hypothetical protein